MSNLMTVLRFGLPYLGRYWGRFLAGVLLAFVFSLSNASFLLATKTTLDRMSPVPTESQEQASKPSAPAAPGSLKARLDALKQRVESRTQELADPWLPRTGRALEWRQLLGGLLLFPLLAAMRGYTGYLSTYCLAWVCERMVNDLRVDVLKKLVSLSLDYFNRSTMGDLLTRINSDTGALQRCLSLGLSDLVKESITIVVLVAGLFVIDWQLTLLAVVFFPLSLVPVIQIGRKVRRATFSGNQTTITQHSLLVEMLSSIRVVKAFSLENQLVQRYIRLSQELLHYLMKSIRAKELINPILEVVSAVGFGLILVIITYKAIRIADLVTLLTGIAFLYTPVKKLAGIHVLFQQASVGVTRLAEVLNEQPSVKEPANPVHLAAFQSRIEFRDVSFAYGQQTVLHNLNLDIPRGTKIGLAGESGSGKSTIVNLLCRFYDPTRGSILIDGRDLREVAIQDLRHLTALVTQEVIIFDQTAAENIACGKPNPTREEVEQAAREAYAHDFMLKLDNGYDTRLGERGVTLSGGQRQRISIARAFIRNAPILLLDEATGSLDSQAESEIQAVIDRLAENRTVICVAHRLSTLAKMDRIIVLSNGRVIEQGGFVELLERGGAFAEMARRQGIGPGGP
jgi:ABC-type multidrug transport system fused ATPase/permease subunit